MVVTRKEDCWGGMGGFRDVKGKERVPVPVAGPAFRGGVKFVMFNVLGGFLQPAAEIESVQSPLPPVCDPRLEWGKERGKRREVHGGEKGGERAVTRREERQMSDENKMDTLQWIIMDILNIKHWRHMALRNVS